MSTAATDGRLRTAPHGGPISRRDGAATNPARRFVGGYRQDGAVDRDASGPARHDRRSTSQKNILSTICGQHLGTACVRTRIAVDVMWMNAFNTPARAS